MEIGRGKGCGDDLIIMREWSIGADKKNEKSKAHKNTCRPTLCPRKHTHTQTNIHMYTLTI